MASPAPHILVTVGPSTRPSTKVLDLSFTRGNAEVAVRNETGRPTTLRNHSYLWQLWRTPGIPATARQEKKLIRAAAAAPARKPTKVDPGDKDERGDITALVNALRCGCSFADLESSMPGLDPAILVQAHADLEWRRSTAETAWERLTKAADVEKLDEFGPAASTLLPVAVKEIARAATPQDMRKVGAALRREVKEQSAHTKKIELVLDAARYPAPVLVEIGRLLYDPFADCMWAHPLFLPPRVGALTPQHLRSLLAGI